jgi:hypothetical protein
MADTALDRRMHLGHRHRTLLGHQRVEDRPEHHAVAEPTERRRDHGFATPGRPFNQRAEDSLKCLWRV